MTEEQIKSYISDIQATNIEQFKDKAAEVEQFRIKYLGKKGVISDLFDQFKALPNDQKKVMGQLINQLKVAAQNKLEEFKSFVEQSSEFEDIHDLTMPVDFAEIGSRHVLSVVMNENYGWERPDEGIKVEF